MKSTETTRMRESIGIPVKKLGVLGALVLIAVLPYLLSTPQLRFAVNTSLMLVIAVSWSILARTGQESFGHAALFGVGGYTVAVLSTWGGTSAFVNIVAAAMITLFFGYLISFPLLRTTGAYFALAFLAIAEVLRQTLLRVRTLGAEGGMTVDGYPAYMGLYQLEFYLAALAALVVVLVSWQLSKTRFELAGEAIRDNVTSATAAGISRVRYQRIGLLVSSLFTGIAGGMYIHVNRFVQPEIVFGLERSLDPLVYSLFGGAFTILGPVVGTIILRILEFTLFAPYLGGASVAVLGIILIIVVLFMPEGIWPKVYDRLSDVLDDRFSSSQEK